MRQNVNNQEIPGKVANRCEREIHFRINPALANSYVAREKIPVENTECQKCARAMVALNFSIIR